MQLGIAYLGSPADAGSLAREAEQAGADTFTCGETEMSAACCCMAALAATQRIEIGTNISIAFARSPVAAAMEAYTMISMAPGRTFYGIASQIKQVIERRFHAAFDDPVGRLGEYVEIMRRTIRQQRGERVEPFEGRYYRVTQFGFFGTPQPDLEGVRVYLGAVGPRMTRLAADKFDGLLAHGVSTPSYLEEKVRPVIGGVHLQATAMTSVDDDVDAARERARWALAFYGSTPAYEPTFRHEGFPDLPARLRQALRHDGKAAAAALVPDEVLNRYMLVGRPGDIAEQLDRYRGVVDRLMLGGIGVGATRKEVVDNTRNLIDVVRHWRALTGAAA